MGDRIATIDMGRKVCGGTVPLSVGELGLHLTQCRLAEAYLRTKWHLDPSNRLTTIRQHYRQTGQTTVPYSIGRIVTCKCNGRLKYVIHALSSTREHGLLCCYGASLLDSYSLR